MNEWTHFFIKIYISHILFSKGLMLVGCERWVGDGDGLLHIDPSSSDHSRTSFSSTLGHWGPKALCQPLALTSASCPQLTPTPTDSSRLCPGYIFVCRPPASAVLPLIYTGASLDWRLGRGSICYNHPILIFQNSTRGIFLHVRLHPPHTHILQIMLKDNNSKNTKRNYLNNSKNTKRN